MVVVSETKESQLLALLEQCVHLDADVRPRTEKGFFTVTVPPPWNGSARRAAQAIQDQIKEWSKQYRRFHECVEAGTDMAGWNWSQLSVPEKVTRRFEFHSRQNLHQIAQRPLLRHKLGKTLEHHFQWRDAEKILIYDDGAPYSFFFEEVTPRGTGICGGIILHGADNLQKAQYSVHT